MVYIINTILLQQISEVKLLSVISIHTGVANFMSAVSSGYPVSGSFSRSALNTASGSRTAMSKAFTVSILVLTVAVFTPYVYYVPNAALTAIIWASIYNLWKFSDLW